MDSLIGENEQNEALKFYKYDTKLDAGQKVQEHRDDQKYRKNFSYVKKTRTACVRLGRFELYEGGV